MFKSEIVSVQLNHNADGTYTETKETSYRKATKKEVAAEAAPIVALIAAPFVFAVGAAVVENWDDVKATTKDKYSAWKNRKAK